MMYGIKVRMNNLGPVKFLMISEDSFDLTRAFARADELLEENPNCFAEIVEEKTDEVVATISGTSN